MLLLLLIRWQEKGRRVFEFFTAAVAAVVVFGVAGQGLVRVVVVVVVVVAAAAAGLWRRGFRRFRLQLSLLLLLLLLTLVLHAAVLEPDLHLPACVERKVSVTRM